MWYFDDGNLEYYYLTSPEDRGVGMPTRLPLSAPSRRVQDTDLLWDTFRVRSADGRRNTVFRWIYNSELPVVEEVKAEFPKVVTIQNLAEFFKSLPQKSATIRLDSSTTVNRSDNFSSFVLSSGGQRLIAWTPERLYWYRKGNLSQNDIDSLRKYLGKVWTIVVRDGVVGLQNEKSEWFAASENGAYTLDGKQIELQFQKVFIDPALAKYNRLLDSIRRYVDLATPSKIRSLARDMKASTHAITTRCDGCQRCNGSHLAIHMVREELDPYLIYSAYDAFGEEQFGGAIRQTWDLIADPNLLNVAKFRGILKSFLLDALRSKITTLCYAPLGRRSGSNAWKVHSHTRMRVAEGTKLVPVREEEPGMSDGEFLWRNNRDAERRRRRNANEVEHGINEVALADPPLIRRGVRAALAWPPYEEGENEE